MWRNNNCELYARNAMSDSTPGMASFGRIVSFMTVLHSYVTVEASIQTCGILT